MSPDSLPRWAAEYEQTKFYPHWTATWKGKPLQTLFNTQDEQFHREQKKKVASAYSQTELLESEAGVDKCTNTFTGQLDQFAATSTPVDLGTWLQYYAFDVVGEFTFGDTIGFLKAGTDIQGMMKAIFAILIYASAVGMYPFAHSLLLGNPLMTFFLPAIEATDLVLNFTLKTMYARLEEANAGATDKLSAKRDMCSKWTAIKPGTEMAKLNELEMVANLTSNMVAGSDTTAIALRSIIYNLLKHPDKRAKAVREIDDADRAGLLSPVVQFRESKAHLPYLGAVIKEAMRVHPSVGLILERHVPAGGAVICGKWIPANTVVGINAWVVHRNADIFENPDSFVPERWIENSAEKLKVMEQSIFTFGAGARTCIGRNISLMEMAKIVPQLLRRYEFALVKPEKEWKLRNCWFVLQEGLICTVKKREL